MTAILNAHGEAANTAAHRRRAAETASGRAHTAKKLVLAALLVLLMAAGCEDKRTVTLYIPADGALTATTARAEATPEGLVRALQNHDALPDAAWSYLYCACKEESFSLRGETGARVVVRLDIADELGTAIEALEDERPAVQALANTFLTYYDAEVFVLTMEGVNLQTRRTYYDHGIVFDEYAATN